MGEKKCMASKFTRCFKAPFRFLIKARDFYVHAMSDWAARMEKCSGAAGCSATTPFSVHQDSFSFHSSRNSTQNEELAELIRAASAGNKSSNRVDDPSKILQQPPGVKSPVVGGCGARRRGRIGIERIEEEMSCEFEEDATVETPSG